MAGPRRSSFAAVFLVSAAACATSGASRPLSDSLPVAIPSARARAQWERIDGAYDAGAEHVRYALFVDPERPLLFRITQYRVSRRIAAGGGRPRLEDAGETVIWNESPGERVPLRCFAEERRRHAWLAFARPSWRDVVPATEEFRAQMRRALEIYARVNAEGRAGPVVR